MKAFTRRARPVLRQLWARLLLACGCLWWAKRQLRRRGAAIVLTFHRVLPDAELRRTFSLPGMVVRERTFEQLAAYIAAEYQAFDCDATVRQAPGSKLRVVLTFDDGWKDTYSNAMPVALRYGIPLTVFICPGLIGRHLPFWPERIAALLRSSAPAVPEAEIERTIEILKNQPVARRMELIAGLSAQHDGSLADCGDRTVSWDDIAEMDAAGIRLGCHTQTHQILTGVPPQTARREVSEGKRALELALGKRCDLFAYPNGNCSQAMQQVLAEEGFDIAFTTERGAWTQATDPLAVPRVNICEANVTGLAGGFSPGMFEYTVFWKAWRALREGAPRAGEAPSRACTYRGVRQESL